MLPAVTLVADSHANLARYVSEPIGLIVFNLGYLPGGDKARATQAETTLASLQVALDKLTVGGLLSVTMYWGHEAGKTERAAVLHWAAALERSTYHCVHTDMCNQPNCPPEILFVTRKKSRKYAALKRIVDYYPQIYGIIFCRTRKETQEIADKLMQDGYNADSLHGELSQAQRDTVMQKFRIRNLQILVATDVAARGLDVDDLTHVINYGLPDDTESYTHRSGRTGRAGKTGTSIAIINLREKGKMREIERIISKKFIVGEMPTGKQICEKQLLKVIDDLEKVKVNEEDMADFMPEIYRKLDWLSKEDLIKRMVSHEFNRFSEYYRNREEIEMPTDSRGERNSRGGSERTGDRNSRKADPGFTRLFINLGKMDNFFPNELISLLNGNTRGRVELGRIDLMKNFSFFEVDEKEAGNVVKALNRANWNGRKVSVEIAGEEGKEAPKSRRKSEGNNYGKKEFEGKKRSFKDEKRSDASGKRSDAPRKSRSKSESAPADKKKSKPSREERGYTDARGKKDDWRQFFQSDNKEFRDKEPDFSEEGWARRAPKKK